MHHLSTDLKLSALQLICLEISGHFEETLCSFAPHSYNKLLAFDQ
jgi:hypothetical protein